MKKLIFLSVSAVFLSVSCGPAAEDRDMMKSRSKIIADSMANLIKTAMQEAESPPNVVIVRPDSNAAKTNTAAPANPNAPK